MGDHTTFLDTPLGQVFLQNSCKLVRVPVGADAFRPTFVLGPRGEVTTPQAAGTKILPSRELNEPHLVTQRSMRPSATYVMLSCSSRKRHSLNVTLKVSSRRAGAGSKAAAVL